MTTTGPRQARKEAGLNDLTQSEWDIMRVVWAKEPCAAGDVQEGLQATHNWSYSTVKTMMERMASKGFLGFRHVRNIKLFSSCISENEARKGALRRFVGKAFNGALGPMMQFLVDNEELSEQELDELRKSIARSRNKRHS